MSSKKKWFSPGEVAARLGISVPRVQQLRQEGKLTGEQLPMGYVYSDAEITRLEKARAKKRAAAAK